jgi:hypothetical protein
MQRALQSKLGIKIRDPIKRIVTRGHGGGEGPKSVTYQLNGPFYHLSETLRQPICKTSKKPEAVIKA